MPGGQHLRPDEEIDGAADVGVTLHPLAGLIVAQLIAVDDLVGRLAEDIDVLIADLLRSEEHTSELQSLSRISYTVFCLKKKNK